MLHGIRAGGATVRGVSGYLDAATAEPLDPVARQALKAAQAGVEDVFVHDGLLTLRPYGIVQHVFAEFALRLLNPHGEEPARGRLEP